MWVTELAGQELHAVLNPPPPVFEIFAGDRIFAAQERAPDTAAHTVIDADFGGVEKEAAANAGHGNSPEDGVQKGWKHRNSGHFGTYVLMYTSLGQIMNICQATPRH